MANAALKEALKAVTEGKQAIVSNTELEARIVTLTDFDKWLLPPFQRDFQMNDTVRIVSEEIKQTQCCPGIITLGRLVSDLNTLYLLDGQHRVQAMWLSGLSEFYVDLCIMTFPGFGDMGITYVKLNSKIRPLRPDDKIKGLVFSHAPVKHVTEECPFVGFGKVRRGGNATSSLLSLSATLRCWAAARLETPSASGKNAIVLAETLTMLEAEHLCRFLNLTKTAWGDEPQNFRLWGALNLTICMWLYVRTVLETQRGVKRYAVLDKDQFKKCLMSVAASADYNDWLGARNLSERDRSPCYSRLRKLFGDRLREEGLGKVMFPLPSWSSSLVGERR